MVRITAGILFCVAAWAQAPAFEVASVKAGRAPLPEFDRGESVVAEPGALSMRSVRLITAVCWAYDAQDYQIDGPPWLNEERYDIMAKAGDAVPAERLRAMLRTLLAERFQMAVHRQTKEMEGLIITVGKNGHKLREAKEPGSVKTAKMGAVSQGGTLGELFAIATHELRVPMVDQTGLDGHYDFRLDLSPYITPDTNKNADALAVVAAAFRDQLGLKAEAKKIPVEMVIVDRAEKRPSEN